MLMGHLFIQVSRPAFLIIKRTSGVEQWAISDNKRSPENSVIKYSVANASDAEAGSGNHFDSRLSI